MRKIAKHPAISMPYAQYAQQMEGARKMTLEIRRKLIEDYRALGYIVEEHGDSIHIEKPLK